jgi:VIT1/CCC1 family predicted Fe2+/Mn2+ transporter
VGDESVQLRKIADTIVVCLRHTQEEKAQATQALKKAREEIIEQCQAAQQEKNALQEKFEEDREKIQKEKENLLAKQVGIEEIVNISFHFMTGLEKKIEEPIEHQVMKLAEVIQQLQKRVVELELHTIPQTP